MTIVNDATSWSIALEYSITVPESSITLLESSISRADKQSSSSYAIKSKLTNVKENCLP
jgi:hypothetical protein